MSELLPCPACHVGELIADEEPDQVVCQTCGVRFRMEVNLYPIEEPSHE